MLPGRRREEEGGGRREGKMKKKRKGAPRAYPQLRVLRYTYIFFNDVHTVSPLFSCVFPSLSLPVLRL